ncbi:MAG: DUF5050 domain-containing protein [Clostridium sp.]|nr:DUF5050 domain-containing protein [Acetatifactor muris]MCM1527395.1 DUF5050 domain-containing protein [Bacteroides sp.]MCM1563541.1 DUF5050 domain-containing protein [Clostridium sp.]
MAKKNKDTKFLIFFLPPVIILFLAGMLAAVFSGRVKSNPPGTIGNTAGNINNGGLFCEYNGTVYFSNAADGGSLYAMNADETDIRKLNSMKVCNLLAGGDYLYYFQLGSTGNEIGFGSVANTHSLNRCNLKGQKVVSVTRDVVVSGQLIDDYLYLLTSGREHPIFYKIKTDKSEQVHLADYAINPACAANGIIYYNGTQEDHALYILDTATDVSSLVWDGNLWYPVLSGDYIYYMDVSSDYRLCRYSLSERAVEILTNDRVECFNVGAGYIYYQTGGADPKLKCMQTDGSNALTVAEGIYTDINMTSQYVYFREFDSETTMYHTRFGSDMYSAFSPQ